MKRRRLVVTPRAKQEIKAIVAWYRRNMGPRAAAKVLRTLSIGVRATATITLAAATRADLQEGCYRVIAKAHLVIFRVENGAAHVVRILHAARDMPSAIEEGI